MLKRIDINEIVAITSSGRYAKIILTHGVELVSVSLAELDKQLSGDLFCRIHRFHIIQMRYVEKICAGRVILGKLELPIGREFQAAFLNRLNILGNSALFPMES